MCLSNIGFKHNGGILGETLFERQVLKIIYTPLNEGSIWRNTSHDELYTLLQHTTIIQKLMMRNGLDGMVMLLDVPL